MLTFKDSDKSLKPQEDLSKTMTTYDFNVNHSNPQDGKVIYEFEKEMKFDIKQKGRKIPRNNSPTKLLN